MIAVVFNPVAAFLTTGGLPPRARALLDLPWSDRQERRYQRFATLRRSLPVIGNARLDAVLAWYL